MEDAGCPAAFGDGRLCGEQLAAIEAVYAGDRRVWKRDASYRWLQYLWATRENDFNAARVADREAVPPHNTLGYVCRTLLRLQTAGAGYAARERDLAALALAWAEAAKGGMPGERARWAREGISLADHARGSADLFLKQEASPGTPREAVALLIRMHGALGQYLQGEIAPDGLTLPLTSERGARLLKARLEVAQFPFDAFCRVLALVSECVLAGVSDRLADAPENRAMLQRLRAGKRLPHRDVQERVLALCGCREGWHARLSEEARRMLEGADLWYADGALHAMGFEKAVRFLNALAMEEPLQRAVSREAREEDFCGCMVSLKGIQQKLYFYHGGRRYTDYCVLSMLERAMANGVLEDTGHLRFSIQAGPHEASVEAVFTETGGAVDGFYRALVVSDLSHNRAVLAAFDQLGYRSDIFDRVGNEEGYLEEMNRAADDKRKLLRFLRDGQRVLDVGPGGGVFLELVQGELPNCRLAGADLSTEVCRRLRRKVEERGYGWEILHADFLSLDPGQAGRFDAVVFCSIIHEIFSYGEFEGRRYNKAVIPEILRHAARLLNPGGRIIIRDGIAAEDNRPVLVTFLDGELEALARDYAGQFRGFDLRAERPGQTGREHLWRMPYNSMMELLYTVTWGKESLPFEVEEWYGYYSKADWLALAESLPGLRLLSYEQYLQEGYVAHLAGKVRLADETGNALPLPDSNAVLVFELEQKETEGERWGKR